MHSQFIDTRSVVVALVATLLSFLLIFKDTVEFFGSLAAALMVGGLTWIAYVLMKWVILALNNKDK